MSLVFDRYRAFVLSVILLMFLTTLDSKESLGSSTPYLKPSKLPSFSSSPSVSEWRSFQAMKSNDYKVLWDSLHAIDRGYETWSWEWKLGWLRTCQRPDEYCDDLVANALQDRAAVIRLNAAKKAGAVYFQTGKPRLKQILQKELGLNRNIKLKKSFPVLAAIKQSLMCLRTPQEKNRKKNAKQDKFLNNKLAKLCRKS